MNILFLTLSRIESIQDRGIYTDLIREFSKYGHTVFIVSPIERRFKQQTKLVLKDNVNILNIKTLNIKKTNFIEKGIGILMLENQYYTAIKKYFYNVKFDLILYSTPPITFTKIIQKFKQKHNAKSYLLLKDIFPQNAIDIELFSKKSLFYKFFRKKETKLYALSDFIGCMSPANVEYILKHNPEITIEKVEICPNSIELNNDLLTFNSKDEIRKKFGISKDSVTFIYGGNLGKPQGVDFIYNVLKSNNDKKNRFFVIVGSGTEYKKIGKWFDEENFSNAILIKSLPKKDYDNLLQSCDVGMIFLDNRFTIPNYPSRLLSYLKNKLPILAATDKNTDIGKIAEENQYGFWCINGELDKFNYLLEKYTSDVHLIKTMGDNGYNYLKENYTVGEAYRTIISHF
jgi:hypothetical protein